MFRTSRPVPPVPYRQKGGSGKPSAVGPSENKLSDGLHDNETAAGYSAFRHTGSAPKACAVGMISIAFTLTCFGL